MKKKLRAAKLLERLSHHPDEKNPKDQNIVKKLLSSRYFKNAKKILFYLPIHKEVDLIELFEKGHKGKRMALPKVVGKGKMHLHYIKDLSETQTGKFNIKEPRGHLKEAKPQELELILVPGVAFAHDGHRIGYGKGFYDRLLKNTSAIKIGIAYEFQIVKNIPAQSHDTPVDFIATEKRIYRIPIK
ncbi:5-formyltetrahydrofolate cyclo-ligase [Pseudomonadota bacterium]